MGEPTPYADLNGVLAELVTGVRTILGPNFCGAYLQGSFAVGDADKHSDVDFIVVTEDEVTAEQESAIQAMHERIYGLDVPWAQHLEGSYVPKDRLRRVDPLREPYLYLDNGATELTRDNHCNTAVVRWSLREYGVVLAGPDPKSVVEPVSAAQLRSEVLGVIDDWVAFAKASQTRFEIPGAVVPGMSRWRQTLLVLSFCRLLHTLESGTVTSKRQAGEWALGALDAGWASLIRPALDDRPDPWRRVHEPADPEAIDRTLAFVDYAVRQAAAYRG